MEENFNTRILYLISPGWPKDDAAGFVTTTEALEQFSYKVTMVEPGEAAMLSSSAANYFKSEFNLIKQVAKSITDITQRPVNIGIGNGLFVARIAALHNAVIPQDKTGEFLAGLSIKYLPDKEVTNFLLRMGIKTLSEFTAIEDSLVTERLGLIGKWCHDLAKGKAHNLNFENKKPVFSNYTIFDPPSFSYEQILFQAKQLSESFINSITEKGLVSTSIQLKVFFENLQTFEKLWYSSSPFNKKNLVDRLRWFLDILQPESAVERIEFTAKDLVFNGHFQDNFSFITTKENPTLDRALEHIEVILGQDYIYKSSLQPRRRPNCFVEKIPYYSKKQLPYLKVDNEIGLLETFNPNTKKNFTEKSFDDTWIQNNTYKLIDDFSEPWPSDMPSFYPSIFYENPIKIDIIGKNELKISVSSKAITSDIPNLIVGTRFKKKIATSFGPWPVSEYWWDESKFRRLAYMQLITEDETAVLVYSLKQQWYLAGIYD